MGVEPDRQQSSKEDFQPLPDNSKDEAIKLEDQSPGSQAQRGPEQNNDQGFITGPKLALIIAALYATMFLVALVRALPFCCFF